MLFQSIISNIYLLLRKFWKYIKLKVSKDSKFQIIIFTNCLKDLRVAIMKIEAGALLMLHNRTKKNCNTSISQ